MSLSPYKHRVHALRVLIILLVCLSSVCYAKKKRDYVITPVFHGTAEVIDGGTFKYNIQKLCKVYYGSEKCKDDECEPGVQIKTKRLGQKCGPSDDKTKWVRVTGLNILRIDTLCEDDKGDHFACGQEAKTSLENLLEGQNIECINSPIATLVEGPHLIYELDCYVKKINLSELVVYSGWARTKVDSNIDLKDLEEAARKGRAGMWR